MKSFFYGIEDLFVNGLFAPYDAFRFMDSWWGSNTVNWLFTIIWICSHGLLDGATKNIQ